MEEILIFFAHITVNWQHNCLVEEFFGFKIKIQIFLSSLTIRPSPNRRHRCRRPPRCPRRRRPRKRNPDRPSLLLGTAEKINQIQNIT